MTQHSNDWPPPPSSHWGSPKTPFELVIHYVVTAAIEGRLPYLFSRTAAPQRVKDDTSPPNGMLLVNRSFGFVSQC
jgi:hypothetical protein